MKKLKDYTHEELLKMSVEELSQLLDSEKRKVEPTLAIEKENYQKLSDTERLGFWASNLHNAMRWQVESGYDPYAIFNKEWYEQAKGMESNIDLIMNEIFMNYWTTTGSKWDREEYLKRIRE
ncbi:MAG: hypothetical protein ACRCYO_17685 [Bacteroidia bacterium]